MKTILCVILMLLANTVLASSGAANVSITTGVLGEVSRTGKLLVGIRKDACPIACVAADKPEGYAVKLLDGIVKKVSDTVGRDVTVVYVPVDSSSRFSMMDDHKIHMEIGITTITKARMEKYDFSYVYYSSTTRALVKNAAMANIPLKELFASGNVYYVENTSTLDMLTSTYANAKAVACKTYAEAWRRFNTDKQAAALVGTDIMLAQLNKEGGFTAKWSTYSGSFEPLAALLPKGDTAFMEVVNKSLGEQFYDFTARKLLTLELSKYEMSINRLTIDAFNRPSTTSLFVASRNQTKG